MTRSQPHDAARRAEGQPVLVAVHPLAGQARPLLVTTLRPLAVVACEALVEADRVLAHDGARLAVKPAGGVLAHSSPFVLQK